MSDTGVYLLLDGGESVGGLGKAAAVVAAAQANALAQSASLTLKAAGTSADDSLGYSGPAIYLNGSSPTTMNGFCGAYRFKYNAGSGLYTLEALGIAQITNGVMAFLDSVAGGLVETDVLKISGTPNGANVDLVLKKNGATIVTASATAQTGKPGVAIYDTHQGGFYEYNSTWFDFAATWQETAEVQSVELRDPMVMMQYSDDSGKTWSSEQWMSAGKIGEYRKQLQWTRLGRSRDRIFKIAVSDPVDWAIIQASLGLEIGKS